MLLEWLAQPIEVIPAVDVLGERAVRLRIAQGLREQMTRLRNRIFKLLTLLYPPADIDAARWTLDHGDSRGRSGASEYLDNILSAPLRKQVLPVIEDMPQEERVRRGRKRNRHRLALQLGDILDGRVCWDQ